jgi:hypothetical protein
MKKIEVTLNILHYCVFRAHYKLHLLANKVNPFWLLAELPFFKRRYEQLGVDIHKEVNIAFGDKNTGLSVMVAGGVLLAVLFFLFFGITNILMNLMSDNASLSSGYFIVFGVLSAIVCYFFVFKKDKYLLYFKKFEGWTKSESRKYGWISFIFIVGVLIMFLGPLIWHI